MFEFNYCSLISMFHNRKRNNCINRIHEQTFRIAYHDDLSFADLLKKGNSVTTHLQLIATEMFPVKMDYFLKSCLKCRSDATHFRIGNVTTNHCGLQLGRYIGPNNLEYCAKPHEINVHQPVSKIASNHGNLIHGLLDFVKKNHS